MDREKSKGTKMEADLIKIGSGTLYTFENFDRVATGKGKLTMFPFLGLALSKLKKNAVLFRVPNYS